MKTLLIASVFASFVSLGALGCDEADEVIDCAKICEKYDECIDEDTDVGACIDECEDTADQSEDAADQADACESCIDDRSCTGATFNCAVECAPFLRTDACASLSTSVSARRHPHTPSPRPGIHLAHRSRFTAIVPQSPRSAAIRSHSTLLAVT